MNLTKAIVKENYLELNDIYNPKENCLAMGCPLFKILAELFLINIEIKHIFSE